MACFRPAEGPVDRDAMLEELTGEGLFVIEWTDSAGVVYPEHSHPSREVRWVLGGTMRLTAGGKMHELGPGDRLDLEPDEPHAAEVGPDGVRYLSGSSRSPDER